MDILLSKSDWGMDDIGTVPDKIRAVAEAGFDAIECFFVNMEPDAFVAEREQYGLKFNAGMVAPTADAFRQNLSRVLAFDPILINCHGGRDYYDFDQGRAFFSECMAIAAGETDIQVVFETHRRCTLYSPWATRRYLEALPDLRICADFSHFTVVSEGDMTSSVSGLPDAHGLMSQDPDPEKAAMMAIAIDRADHIHARVGDLHRPQVHDPRIGDGQGWTDHFEAWWDRIVAARRADNRPFLTICPEYGPPPYAPADPITGVAYAEPWDVAVWAKDRLKARWQE